MVEYRINELKAGPSFIVKYFPKPVLNNSRMKTNIGLTGLLPTLKLQDLEKKPSHNTGKLLVASFQVFGKQYHNTLLFYRYVKLVLNWREIY